MSLMNNIEELEAFLDIKKCYCGGAECDFYGSGFDYGDQGRSYTTKEIEKMLKISIQLQKHFERLLKKR